MRGMTPEFGSQSAHTPWRSHSPYQGACEMRKIGPLRPQPHWILGACCSRHAHTSDCGDRPCLGVYEDYRNVEMLSQSHCNVAAWGNRHSHIDGSAHPPYPATCGQSRNVHVFYPWHWSKAAFCNHYARIFCWARPPCQDACAMHKTDHCTHPGCCRMGLLCILRTYISCLQHWPYPVVCELHRNDVSALLGDWMKETSRNWEIHIFDAWRWLCWTPCEGWQKMRAPTHSLWTLDLLYTRQDNREYPPYASFVWCYTASHDWVGRRKQWPVTAFAIRKLASLLQKRDWWIVERHGAGNRSKTWCYGARQLAPAVWGKYLS